MVSPAKSAVKRKQKELVAHSGEKSVKHRRSVSAADELTRTDDVTVRKESAVENHTGDDSWADAESKAARLRLMLERERRETDDFETYLSRALSDSASQSSPSAGTKHSSVSESLYRENSQLSLTEQISRLQNSLLSEREANRLFELQLLQICPYD